MMTIRLYSKFIAKPIAIGYTVRVNYIVYVEYSCSCTQPGRIFRAESKGLYNVLFQSTVTGTFMFFSTGQRLEIIAHQI